MEKLDAQKLRGGYYTPKEITQFVSNWAIQSSEDTVLEPSCGDGNFVEAICQRLIALDQTTANINKQLRGVELIAEEAEKTRSRIGQLGIAPETIINSDFFHFLEGTKEISYDVVVGNPPFIRYQNFPEEHRSLAMARMESIGLSPNRLTNIWLPFLVIGSTLLREKGRLGMVIPAELFQVKYAAECRVFLSEFFDRITIVTFNKLVFSGIQQEVVLLLCEKQVQENQGVRVVELNSLPDLAEFTPEALANQPVKSIDHTKEKWTKYFLDEREIGLLREVARHPNLVRASDIMEVDVGIVTGRNDFFMLTEEQVSFYGLGEWVQPVASKSPQLEGLCLTAQDFQNNAKKNHSIFLFIPPNLPIGELPEACQKYIRYGESKGYHTGYKTRIRKRWYITPSLWIPDAFALRQVNGYPKLVMNEAEASSTDTIHRVRFKEGTNGLVASQCFLNSLTMAFSEITGRSYGGGVLTFEPTETEALWMPYQENHHTDTNFIDERLRNKAIRPILDMQDEILLDQYLGLEKRQINDLRNIWEKLSDRRMKRKNRGK